jgi:hypothetical protein
LIPIMFSTMANKDATRFFKLLPSFHDISS